MTDNVIGKRGNNDLQNITQETKDWAIVPYVCKTVFVQLMTDVSVNFIIKF